MCVLVLIILFFSLPNECKIFKKIQKFSNYYKSTINQTQWLSNSLAAF